jgi:hypothetical protein
MRASTGAYTQFSELTIPRMYLQWSAPERRSTEIIRRLHGYLARPLERVRAALDIGRGPGRKPYDPRTAGAGSVLIPGSPTGR